MSVAVRALSAGYASGRASAGVVGEVIEEEPGPPPRPSRDRTSSVTTLAAVRTVPVAHLLGDQALSRVRWGASVAPSSDVFLMLGAPGPVGPRAWSRRVRSRVGFGVPSHGLPPLESSRGTRRAHARGPTGPGTPNVAGRAGRRTLPSRRPVSADVGSPPALARPAAGRLNRRWWSGSLASSPFR